MMSPATPITIDDFERLPDELALNHELVDGEFSVPKKRNSATTTCVSSASFPTWQLRLSRGTISSQRS